MIEPDVKPPHILCVNPWIHDFAAYDFWAKPLGLLGLAAILRDHGMTVSFLDCLDRFHPRAESPVKVLKDGRGPFRKKEIPLPAGVEEIGQRFSRYGIEPEWFRRDLKKSPPPDIIFVTSMMTYWAPGVRETISVIKEIFPRVPVILGGVYASLCTGHARQFSLADQVITGNAEEQLPGIILDHTGYSFTPKYDFNDLNALPRPALDLVSKMAYAPILTSRGCPFSCSYCASSFLEKRLRHRSPETVFQEIQHWHNIHGVNNFAFYDDALLIHPENHIIPLLEKIIHSGMPLSFHTPNAMHIRQISQKIADMMFQAGFKTIRMGLETADFSPSRPGDHKVTGNEFSLAVDRLKQAGFASEQIGAYLLCALPGQHPDDVARSITAVKEKGIQPVLAYYTPIPHTPMWQTACGNSRFDLEKDPVFTNNALLPCMEKDNAFKTIAQLKALTRK
ncbi:B12-binding domain-containing radical SAM protein [Desulfocicer vacuolatum]|uniref:B12-binding domain-containing radical SAM protein n=1 Tax=Desulfocicer vacuolatum TaxID=2298 RepID=UPI000A008DD6|nr:radical SAM protein [Desulfocicer vacuolatum]